jgi:hypothetical protein
VSDNASHQPVTHRRRQHSARSSGGVLLDPLERLAGLSAEDPVYSIAQLEDFAGLDFDIARAASRAAGRLMKEEAVFGKQ